MKKLLALVLCAMMLCVTAFGAVSKDELKVGFIFIGDENEGYTAAHYNGAKEMQKELGLSDDQMIIKWNIPEDETCYDAAVDLADQGCQIIFGNSFSFEDYMMQAAQEFPEVEFCHATGYQAASSGLENMHNYFTSIYESRYVSGVVAGMKLAEMLQSGEAKEAKIGYVGAYPYAEVISGFTAFYNGVKSIVPEATMEVTYVNSWADFSLEKEAAEALMADGCVIISQHADTTGVATAVEPVKGVYMVGYNISMIPTAPTSALTSASINWAPYYTYATKCVLNGEKIAVDWCKGYAEGANCLTELNDACIAEGTKEKVEEVVAKIVSGELQVFGGPLKGVNAAGKELNLAEGEFFAESSTVSAPSFDYIVEGVYQK